MARSSARGSNGRCGSYLFRARKSRQKSRRSYLVKMARIRVVIVLYRDDAIVGGSLRVGEAIANSLDAGRVDARVVFAYGDAGVMTARAKVPVHHIGARSSKDLPGWIRARNLLKKIKPHVIHFVDPVNWIALATLGVGAK